MAQSSLDIDDARRMMESVLPVLKKCGLRAATNKEYQKFLEAQKPDSHKGTKAPRYTKETPTHNLPVP